jgi:NADPH-dependent curcumin reductase CurA
LIGPGVDLYWDNVGGPTLDAVLLNLNDRARVIMCGQVPCHSCHAHAHTRTRTLRAHAVQWTHTDQLVQPSGAGAEHVYDHRQAGCGRGIPRVRLPRPFEEARTKLAQLYRDKKIHYELTTEHGLENLVPSLLGLFEGKNVGKAIVEIAHE